ncbi:MAG: hypothetical protein RL562_2209 [Planctomycetota bacterium]
MNQESAIRPYSPLRDPWLVAVWPGMGAVAHIAGQHLVEHLRAEHLGVIETGPLSELDAIDVAEGLVQPAEAVAGQLYAVRGQGARDVLVFVGTQQPKGKGLALCRVLANRARSLGVQRVLTFAAMASGIHPTADPRVLVAATAPALLGSCREQGADVLQHGQIAGLNGVLLAAAAEVGIDAACLLGEMPFFAARMPNPKAARAVIQLFGRLAGIPLSGAELGREIQVIEKRQIAQFDKLRRASEGPEGQEFVRGLGAFLEQAAGLEAEGASPEEDEIEGVDTSGLDRETLARIEALFEAAGADRSRAAELKQVLDAHGVFREYEDRFLDLFRTR